MCLTSSKSSICAWTSAGGSMDRGWRHRRSPFEQQPALGFGRHCFRWPRFHPALADKAGGRRPPPPRPRVSSPAARHPPPGTRRQPPPAPTVDHQATTPPPAAVHLFRYRSGRRPPSTSQRHPPRSPPLAYASCPFPRNQQPSAQANSLRRFGLPTHLLYFPLVTSP